MAVRSGGREQDGRRKRRASSWGDGMSVDGIVDGNRGRAKVVARDAFIGYRTKSEPGYLDMEVPRETLEAMFQVVFDVEGTGQLSDIDFDTIVDTALLGQARELRETRAAVTG